MEPDLDNTQVTDNERNALVEKMVLDVMHRHDCRKVGEVVSAIIKFDKSITTDEIHNAIDLLERDGTVNLSEPETPRSFGRALAIFEPSIAFWSTILSSAAILAIVFLVPQEEYWSIARMIAASAFLFFIPGYAFSNALIPRKKLNKVERIAISIGLSLAAVVLLGMILNYGLIGLTEGPIIISIALFSISVGLLAAYREYLAQRESRIMHNRLVQNDSELGRRNT